MMRNIFRKIKVLPLSYTIFSALSILLLSFSIIQVDCPICGSIDLDNQQNGSNNLDVLQVNGELKEYRVNHGWCANAFVSADYEVTATIVNRSSSSQSTSFLIKGEMPMVIMKTYAAALGNKVKLVHMEIAANETRDIKETFNLWAVGLAITQDILSQAEFFIITDPEKIVANCTLCGGTQKVPLAEAIIMRLQ
jgi:hypothetical protein